MKTTFKEEQTFMQSWIGWVMIALFIFPFVGIYQQYISETELYGTPIPRSWLILTAFFIIAIMAFLVSIKLKTEITKYDIKLKFFPLTSKNVSWSEVKSAELVNYGFVGGWGIRLWTKYGTVYNISGNKGVAIELTNGKKFLIGTQKETELRLFLE